jgi:phage gp45-like
VVAPSASAFCTVVDDSGDQQVAQANLNVGAPEAEVIDKMVRLGEYGFFSCPPDGAEAIAVFLGGRRSAGVIIATGYRAARPRASSPAR